MSEDAAPRVPREQAEDSDMERPRWYRSLFWRAAIALIALVAVLLAAEGALFLWLSPHTSGAMPRDPRQMADLIADDVQAALTADRELDLRQHLQEQFGHYFQTILVVMRDGRSGANHDDVEEWIFDYARASLERQRGRRGGFGRGGPPDGFGRGGPPSDAFGGPTRFDFPPDGRGDLSDRRFGGSAPDGRGPGPAPGGFPPSDPRGGPPFGGGPGPGPGRGGWDPFREDFRRRIPLAESAPIILDDAPAGRVIVLTDNPPFSRILALVGRTMGLAAGGVLLVGGALIAFAVFGPPRRRLRQVQQATEQLGDGDLSARAPEDGGDEIAALARSFNHMADELTRRAQALELSDRARRQLLADVSHELMTPLTAMRGYIETLGMTELQLDGPTRERYMRIVSEETTRLENIIGDLLDLARLEGGGTSLRRQRVQVEGLFTRVADRHERELQARNVTLDMTIEPGAEEVAGDADRLEQALQNLVANALRYTPEHGRITITSERRGDASVLTVQDSGAGVPDDQRALVFDRFYKGDASRRATGGSGLGLSIVKAIIERHGGRISVRNQNGAVFEIVLP
jgi:signal transduction histidine kinase